MCLLGEHGRMVKIAEYLSKVFTMKKKKKIKQTETKESGRKGAYVRRDRLHQYQQTTIHINRASERRCWSHEIIAECYKEGITMVNINSGLLGMKNMIAETDSMSWDRKSKEFSKSKMKEKKE